MAIICPPSEVPAQPADGSGWQTGTNQWGAYAAQRKPRTKNAWSGWTVPSTRLHGLKLPQWERSILAAYAHYWKSYNAFTLNSFTTAAGTFTITNLQGHVKTPNAFQLYMWAFLPYQRMQVLAYNTIPHLSTPFPTIYWGGPNAELPPPAITAATIDNDMACSLTATVSSSFRTFALLISPPVTTLRRIPQMLAVYPFHTNIDSTHIQINMPSAWALDLLKPFPSGSQALLGLRETSTSGQQVRPNSPIAAELVTVGG
jgi:hypothetical protein